MTLDLSPIVQALVSAMALAITAAVPVAMTWLFQHLKISKDSLAATTINTAVTAVSQAAISTMTKAVPTGPIDLTVKASAIATAVDNLSPGTLAAMALRGVSKALVAQRVDGEITKALAPTAKVTT